MSVENINTPLVLGSGEASVGEVIEVGIDKADIEAPTVRISGI